MSVSVGDVPMTVLDKAHQQMLRKREANKRNYLARKEKLHKVQELEKQIKELTDELVEKEETIDQIDAENERLQEQLDALMKKVRVK